MIALFLLSAVIGAASCLSANPHKIDVSCDYPGLLMRMTFEKPFKGIVFTMNNSHNPLCSSPAFHHSSTEIHLNVPMFECGINVQVTTQRPWIASTIVIQHHRILKTTFDTMQTVICRLARPLPISSYTSLDRHIKGPPKVTTWLELKYGPEIFSAEEVKERGLENALLLVLRVKDAGYNKDVVVRNCIAHNETIVTESTSIYQMSDPSGCRSSSKSLSEFTVANKSKAILSDLMAYAEVNAFHINTRGKLYVTCGVELCRDFCKRSCSIPGNSPYYITTASHRLMKRSAVENSTPSIRQMERSNILKTIKVLTAKLLTYNKRNSSQIETDFKRRALDVSTKRNEIPILSFSYTEKPGDLATALLATASIVDKISTYEINSSSISTKPAFSDDDSGVINPNSLTTDIYNTSNVSKKSIFRISAREIALLNTSFTASMPQFEFSTFPSTFIDSIPTETTMDSTTPSIGNETDIIISSTVVETRMHDSKSSTDVHSSVAATNSVWNESADKTNSTSKSENFLKDCVPRIRFHVVTTVLCVIVLSLILTCIGMALYMRKEKKRHLINNFLLYDFY